MHDDGQARTPTTHATLLTPHPPVIHRASCAGLHVQWPECRQPIHNDGQAHTPTTHVTPLKHLPHPPQCAGQAVQAFIRSGLDAGNQFTTTVKPTLWAWNECHITDCSTRVQVPYPYCKYDCVGTNYCSVNSEFPLLTAALGAWVRPPVPKSLLHPNATPLTMPVAELLAWGYQSCGPFTLHC